jgi:hypothetical protein
VIRRKTHERRYERGKSRAIIVTLYPARTARGNLADRSRMGTRRHGPNTQNGPRAASIEEHTHHKASSAGSQCVACHMPKIEETIADVNVRAHTFRFITPEETDAYKIPNACNVCHSDKSTEWAGAVLKSWRDRSPWRMDN